LRDALLSLFVLSGFGHGWIGAQLAKEHDANLRDPREELRG
jgi:hypothetical protein